MRPQQQIARPHALAVRSARRSRAPAPGPSTIVASPCRRAPPPFDREQVYEGLTFKLSLKFPTSYPYESPQVTFITPCFHPNVDQYGNICLDILKARATHPRAPLVR